MPAPAVYVLAVLGTVGAVLAFTEFVYEPHIAPAIERWKAEYKAARRRREMEALYEGQSVVQMSQRTHPRHSKDKLSDDESSDDGENHMWNQGQRSSATTKLSKDGLLIRHESHDVELDNLVAPEVNEWRNAIPGQVLRQRKNIPEHTMDESIQAIPFAAMSPIRPHILLDPSSPLSSSPSSHSPSAPAPPGLDSTGGQEFAQSTLPSSPSSPIKHSPPPPHSVHMRAQSTLDLPHQPQASPYLVPSLSQSYPQDLDYEHGLELLSPPSSRADSPFSMAEASPNADLRTLSRSASDFSSTILSPSPLHMGLGNQSYDAISPQPPTLRVPNSVTDSGRSTTYLSFADESSDRGSSSPQPYANLGASIGREGVFGVSSSASPAPGPVSVQPAPIHASFLREHMYADPATMAPSFPPQPSRDLNSLGIFHMQQPQSESSAPRSSHSHFGLSDGGDLSDLDFMSDYQASEPDMSNSFAQLGHGRRGVSDAGDESDSSWSMAGGSAIGSPVMVPAASPARPSSSGLTRGDTIRASVSRTRNGPLSR